MTRRVVCPGLLGQVAPDRADRRGGTVCPQVRRRVAAAAAAADRDGRAEPKPGAQARLDASGGAGRLHVTDRGGRGPEIARGPRSRPAAGESAGEAAGPRLGAVRPGRCC